MDSFLDRFAAYGLSGGLRLFLMLGALVFFGVILFLLKSGKLNVQYSIIWLGAAAALVLVALFPILLLHLRNITGIEVVSNLVFVLLFAFVLLLLLSLSTIVSGFAKRIKRLTQTQAILEKRVRELEAALAQNTGKNAQQGKEETGQ